MITSRSQYKYLTGLADIPISGAILPRRSGTPKDLLKGEDAAYLCEMAMRGRNWWDAWIKPVNTRIENPQAIQSAAALELGIGRKTKNLSPLPSPFALNMGDAAAMIHGFFTPASDFYTEYPSTLLLRGFVNGRTMPDSETVTPGVKSLAQMMDAAGCLYPTNLVADGFTGSIATESAALLRPEVDALYANLAKTRYPFQQFVPIADPLTSEELNEAYYDDGTQVGYQPLTVNYNAGGRAGGAQMFKNWLDDTAIATTAYQCANLPSAGGHYTFFRHGLEMKGNRTVLRVYSDLHSGQSNPYAIYVAFDLTAFYIKNCSNLSHSGRTLNFLGNCEKFGSFTATVLKLSTRLKGTVGSNAWDYYQPQLTLADLKRLVSYEDPPAALQEWHEAPSTTDNFFCQFIAVPKAYVFMATRADDLW